MLAVAVRPPKRQSCANSLDKLAQLVTQKEITLLKVDSLRKRAKAKFITNPLIYRLVNVKGTTLKKSYFNSLKCVSVLEQKGQSITAQYCRQRWCMVCNRIRTGLYIQAYEPVLKEFKDPQFVTLTVKNMLGEKLPESIDGMYNAFNRIKRRLRKRGIVLKGLRKIECTHNNKTDEYHPHYHMIIEGKEVAETLRAEWLKEYPTASLKANDIRQADEGSIKELMKYFTKIFSTQKGEEGGTITITPKALDTIFTAMKGKRVLQPFGIKKHVDEDFERIESKDYDIESREHELWLWEQDCADWVNFQTYESLSNYQPNEDTIELIEIINGKKNGNKRKRESKQRTTTKEEKAKKKSRGNKEFDNRYSGNSNRIGTLGECGKQAGNTTIGVNQKGSS